MFTGIVTDLGRVRAVVPGGDTRFEIATGYDISEIPIGASIACSGVCLTVVDKGPGWFAAQASAETLGRTTLRRWKPGTRVNLERPLKAGDELGGHIVSGHVDAVARIVRRRSEGESERLTIEAPPGFARAVAAKGSVALDGVSLTVNEVEDLSSGAVRFGVNLIPHTQTLTTLGKAEEGVEVNLEIDMLARYVARLLGKPLGQEHP
jgi:riboflavin synthase